MFQMVWLQRAVNDLAAIWMQADSAQRRVITETRRQRHRCEGTQPRPIPGIDGELTRRSSCVLALCSFKRGGPIRLRDDSF